MRYNDMVVYRLSVYDKAKEITQKAGVDYTGILRVNNMQRSSIFDRGPKQWRSYAEKEGLDTKAPLGRVSRELFTRYCGLFMITPGDFLVDENDLPKAGAKKEESKPVEGTDTEDILSAINGLHKDMQRVCLLLTELLKGMQQKPVAVPPAYATAYRPMLEEIEKHTKDTVSIVAALNNTCNGKMQSIINELNTIEEKQAAQEKILKNINNKAETVADKIGATESNTVKIMHAVNKIAS